MSKMANVINCLVLVLGVLMILYYFALGIFVRFGQSLQFLWLLAGGACVLRSLYWLWAARVGKCPGGRLVWILRILLALGLLLFFVGEVIILRAGCIEAPAGLDHIVVLGARVNGREPSGALRNRIEAARDYLRANPGTVAVLSGGQGPDEEISEARCMYEHLNGEGIEPDRLILEERSTDTGENLSFSRALIPEGSSVGLVTNNFHIFRALATARAMDWKVAGVPVPTSLISIPHYYMREFVAVVVDVLKGDLAF